MEGACPIEPARRRRALLALVCAALALVPATAGAATTTLEPQPDAARTLASGPAGWTSSITRQGTLTCSGLLYVPGVTCPQATAGWQSSGGADGAGDGYLGTTVSTLAGLLSTTTVDWTSPAFTVAATPDLASFGVDLRASLGQLTTMGGSASVAATLVDLSDGAHTAPLLASTAVTASSSFSAYGGSISPSLPTPGDQLAIRVTLTVATPSALAVSTAIDLDDVALSLVDLAPPTSLGASVVSDASGTRATGSVDPHGLVTTVAVDYGPTAAYGSTASTVVTGSGAQSYSVPLVGLTPSATYHYRVRATNGDGAMATADDTFAAPSVPGSDGGPLVAGGAGSRNRTAAFDLDGTVTAARIEVLDLADTVLATFPDGNLDGSVAITLPDADGLYKVRVVRTRSGGDTASLATTVSLDRVAPDLAATALAVTPWSGSATARQLAVLGAPPDATSVTAQVVTAGNVPVGAAVPVSGGAAALTLPATPGTYRVRVAFADAAGNTSTLTSADVTLTGADQSTGGGGSSGGGGGAPGTTATAASTKKVCHGTRVRCTRRAVVGKIATRRVRVAGRRVTIAARVPKLIAGSSTLRFGVQAPRGVLARVGFTFRGHALRVRHGGVALDSVRLAAIGRQTLVVRLVPKHGRAVVVRIPFRVRAA